MSKSRGTSTPVKGGRDRKMKKYQEGVEKELEPESSGTELGDSAAVDVVNVY